MRVNLLFPNIHQLDLWQFVKKMDDKIDILCPEKTIPSQSEEFLTQLAKDIVNNLVFTSDHMPHEKLETLGIVFMPLLLGALQHYSEEAVKDIGMIYEYYKQACPTSINGYPTFISFRILNVKDRKLVLDKVDKMKKALDSI